MTRRRDVLAMMAAVPVAVVLPADAMSDDDIHNLVRSLALGPIRASFNGCPCELVSAVFDPAAGMWMVSLREIGGGDWTFTAPMFMPPSSAGAS